MSEVEEKKKKRYIIFIEFENEILKLDAILRISKKEKQVGDDRIFQIVINDGVDESVAWPTFKHITFDYYSERVRQERLEELKDKMKLNSSILFV